MDAAGAATRGDSGSLHLPASGIGIRWTIGDVSARGFEALRLSILGARRVFGPDAAYAVCVNSLPVTAARDRVGDVAGLATWHRADAHVPAFLRQRLGRGMAEGVAWKFAPLRLFPDRYEIALDNDCVLWDMPAAIRRWLDEGPQGGVGPCVLAEDVRACFGWFAPLCGSEPRNAGIRGLPPGFDLEAALAGVLRRAPGIRVAGEVDEQGLQVAALSQARPPLVVTTREVPLCSPDPSHARHPGSCGAHFVGLNMRRPRPEQFCGQDTLDRIAANWDANRPAIAAAVAGRLS